MAGGPLPRNFIKRLFELQRGCCAACRKKVGKNYHVDHIVALAVGGKHEPTNLQILCSSCNVRKWIKDPIEFMQSQGYLL